MVHVQLLVGEYTLVLMNSESPSSTPEMASTIPSVATGTPPLWKLAVFASLREVSSSVSDKGLSSSVQNWHDLEDMNDVYLTELRTTILNSYQGSTILDIIFWNPMIREESFSQTRSRNTSVTPTASYAACPHIDVDVGAHIDSEHLIDLIENNSLDQHGYSFRRDSLIKAIDEGKRFAIVNAWCNIASEPVRRAPLALFSVRYEEEGTAFPQGEPNLERSQWYTFSEVRPDEILFFCQYDRDVRRPSDIWHCSLTGIGNQELDPPRRSFDIRCLIVFDEIVPEKSDRFHFKRTKALMNKEESAVFCSKQSLR